MSRKRDTGNGRRRTATWLLAITAIAAVVCLGMWAFGYVIVAVGMLSVIMALLGVGLIGRLLITDVTLAESGVQLERPLSPSGPPAEEELVHAALAGDALFHHDNSRIPTVADQQRLLKSLYRRSRRITRILDEADVQLNKRTFDRHDDVLVQRVQLLVKHGAASRKAADLMESRLGEEMSQTADAMHELDRLGIRRHRESGKALTLAQRIELLPLERIEDGDEAESQRERVDLVA